MKLVLVKKYFKKLHNFNYCEHLFLLSKTSWMTTCTVPLPTCRSEDGGLRRMRAKPPAVSELNGGCDLNGAGSLAAVGPRGGRWPGEAITQSAKRERAAAARLPTRVCFVTGHLSQLIGPVCLQLAL